LRDLLAVGQICEFPNTVTEDFPTTMDQRYRYDLKCSYGYAIGSHLVKYELRKPSMPWILSNCIGETLPNIL
jgi:hypothetical protein